MYLFNNFFRFYSQTTTQFFPHIGSLSKVQTAIRGASNRCAKEATKVKSGAATKNAIHGRIFWLRISQHADSPRNARKSTTSQSSLVSHTVVLEITYFYGKKRPFLCLPQRPFKGIWRLFCGKNQGWQAAFFANQCGNLTQIFAILWKGCEGL